MTKIITRRTALIAGLAAAGGLALARAPRQLPPTYGNLLRMGDDITYAAHRVLLPGQSLVKEYSKADLTSFPAIGTTNPADSGDSFAADEYRALQQNGFRDWQLSVEGSVAKPRTFTIAELKQLPARTQITRHTCEEGWSAIGQWTGVPLSLVLDAVGILPTARFVSYSSIDDWIDSIDLLDALHPQTILAYGMNGRDLPVPHGAPLRLRVETQLGAKSIKYLNRLVVLDEFDDGGPRGSIRNGWAWDMGI
ncbi:MAG TPA: molybdopterin-dependent oxidoreductase [Candidatus Acidoferrum sp.]|nr:molybdopterin-dependent oxidoreductase [Candidatus Acidoferrum sp.]